MPALNEKKKAKKSRGTNESAPKKRSKKAAASNASAERKPRKKAAPKPIAEDTPAVVKETVRPFSDGVAAVRLNKLIVVPRAGGEEAVVLRAFLRHFQQNKCFVGTVSTKMSFMKKGGRLL